ncbi:hypothetical protein NQ318_010088 [Aromia moschata]|uniref:Uncharacterized protein n=1 Tax=Aromia moschata TaxID=1265417 RepID=A0AAV8Y9K9_9CUCU|nr:hypothetical protein NQ318_010088 [Aromia moschata]
MTELMLLSERCEHVAASLNRTVSGDTFLTLSSLGKSMEQRVNLKFLVKLGKTCTHKFLNGLNGLMRDVKRPKTIRASDGPQREKRTKTLKKIGFVYLHWDTEGQTVNQHYYIELLTALPERARRRRPDLWKTKS